MIEAYIIDNPSNISNHVPVIMKLGLPNITYQSKNVDRNHGVNWIRVDDEDIYRHKENADKMLRSIKLPVDAMYCSNYECSNHCHRKELNRFCSDIIMKLVQAADLSLPKHVKKKRHKPMWRQLVQPEKDTALFCHSVWCSAGRPATGALADIRRRTRSLYHKAIRGLSKEELKLR